MLCLILVQSFGSNPLTHSNVVTILITSNIIFKKMFLKGTQKNSINSF